MKKVIIALICLIPLLISCKEDEDKVIQTDLSIEAEQLFGISQDWNESLYFAMLQWEDYLHIDSLSLPSCPDIRLDHMKKVVTLEFSASTPCAQAGNFTRSGKLIINYDTAELDSTKKWRMEYEDYRFETKSIDGTRYYSAINSLQISEEFTFLNEVTDNDLATEFSGKFLHTRSIVIDTLATDSLSLDSLLVRSRLIGFESVGRITGVNPVGRDFEIIMDTPGTHSVECYEQNAILPTSAKESWIVSRGGPSRVAYSVRYDPLEEACRVTAIATLPDGKQLLLNPPAE